MIRVIVELFVNDKRVFKGIDLKDMAKAAYPTALSVGIDTGLKDKDGEDIYTNSFVVFKTNLCRLTLAIGEVMIKHPKFGNCPLHKYAMECKVVK